MNYPNSDSYFSPQFVEEFGLPNSLQLNITPLDWVENPDNAYNEHPTYILGNEGLPSNSDPSGLSMGSSGQLYFPGTVSHVPCGNNFSSYPYPNPLYVKSAQYNYTPHAVPLDSNSTQYFNTSQTEYLNQYRTDWELEMHLLSNSQKRLLINHIGTETLNDNISPCDVRQSYQELGYLPASDHEFNGRVSHGYPLNTLAQAVTPVTHDSQLLENIYPKTAATTTVTNIPSAPYFSNLNVSDSHDSSLSSSRSNLPSRQSIPRYQDLLPATSSFFASPSYPSISTNTTLPPVVPAPYSYPSQGNNLPQGVQFAQFQSSITIPPSLYPMPELTQSASAITIPTPSHPYNPIQSRSCDPSPSSSFSSPPYPITPIDNTTAPITLSSKPTFLPAHQISKRIRPSLPSKKRARTPKKASPSALVPATIKRHEQKQKRELPNKRAAVRSQGWLDKYYPNRGPCTLCKEKKEGEGEENVPAWRRDRALEHLVSSHIIQVVKNMERFEKGVLNRDSRHLLETESQFAFARNEMKKMRCSLCPTVSTSLVFRGSNIKDHLRKVHAELPKSVLQKELKRVRALMPDRTEWYSYQDKFLHYFPRK